MFKFAVNYADFENRVTSPWVSFRISVFVDNTHARDYRCYWERGLQLLVVTFGENVIALQLFSSIKLKYLGVGGGGGTHSKIVYFL